LPAEGTLQKQWPFVQNTRKHQATASEHSPHAIVEDVKVFLTYYLEENAVLRPGGISRYKDEDIKLLSCHETKMGVWSVFETKQSSWEVSSVPLKVC